MTRKISLIYSSDKKALWIFTALKVQGKWVHAQNIPFHNLQLVQWFYHTTKHLICINNLLLLWLAFISRQLKTSDINVRLLWWQSVLVNCICSALFLKRLTWEQKENYINGRYQSTPNAIAYRWIKTLAKMEIIMADMKISPKTSAFVRMMLHCFPCVF